MIKRELIIFLLLFVVLSLGMHMNQWLVQPLTFIKHLGEHKMPYHPLLFSFVFYLLLAIIRFIFRLILKLFHSH